MGSSHKNNKNVLDNERNKPWLISKYELANGITQGTLKELTYDQVLGVIGIPVPLLTFEFNNLPPLYITSYNSDITHDNKLFKASADLIKGNRITNTTELHNDGNTFKLSAIRDDILHLVETKEAKGARVVTQAAFIDDVGDVTCVLDIDVGYVDTCELTIEPLRGTLELSLKTNSVFKRLEGVPSTRLAASAQRARFPNDSSLDYITEKYIQAAKEQAEKDAKIKADKEAADANNKKNRSWWKL